MRSPIRLAAATLAVAVAACNFAPKYQRPASPVAPAFPAAASGAQAAGPTTADLGWRDVFGDPRLQALVALALERNRDLRVAALNVELVQAQYRIQRSELLPRIDVVGGATVARTHADLTVTRKATTATTWTVNGAVTGYELDLFGRVRNLTSAALEQYLATAEARRAAQIALVGAVATQYLANRALDEQIALARGTLDAVQASLALTRRQAEVGRVSELDLRTAESQVETARFNLAAAQQQRARAENALVLLLGGPVPASLPEGLPLDAAEVVAELPAGVPSEVLVRRPDVLAAEHDLRGSNALVGAARAAFFPTITLTGNGGVASLELSTLFDGAHGAWAFLPRITVPIFAGGALKANLDVAQVRKSIQVVRYERAIEQAFREVADALVSRAWIDEQLRAQTARVAAEQRRFELSDRRYRGGVDSYLTVLTAQRDLFAAQQILIQTRLDRQTNLVDLYQTLGGGWNERTVTAAAAEPARP
jgi:outer membrane protein, multidrug efflux system